MLIPWAGAKKSLGLEPIKQLNGEKQVVDLRKTLGQILIP